MYLMKSFSLASMTDSYTRMSLEEIQVDSQELGQQQIHNNLHESIATYMNSLQRTEHSICKTIKQDTEGYYLGVKTERTRMN